MVVASAIAVSCSSSSYGTVQDCAAAGGRCDIGGFMCLKEGPPNTCNCNPGCNPGGAVCCLVFSDGGE
jgi:hypothetical protein